MLILLTLFLLLLMSHIKPGLALENVCETVTCGGQYVCHQKDMFCDGQCSSRCLLPGAQSCNMAVPYCSAKNEGDYKKELEDSKTAFEMTRPNMTNITDIDRDLLCRGFKCFGLGQCKVVSIPCVDTPDCIRFLPACDDSPQLNGAKRLKRKQNSSDQYKGPLSWIDQLHILMVFVIFGLVLLLGFLFLRCLERCHFIPK